MADTLYIIGNGFDLHHGLRTSYANFRDDYACKKKLWNSLTTVFGDKLKDNMWWRDFETQLSQIDYSYGMDSHKGIVPWLLSIDNLLKNEIPPLFGDWLKEIDDKVLPNEELEIKGDAKFFTFNYTMVLEKTYNIESEDVWHIHHSMLDYTQKGENPIVGHDSTIAEQTLRFIEFRKNHPDFRSDIGDMINHNIINGRKNVKNRIVKYGEKFYQYCGIKHFIAMGFSFNDIDMPYMKKICEVNKNLADTDWTLYWYTDGEDIWMRKKLMELGVSNNQITTLRW